ncbi:hypothetical protein A9R05_33850 (plasmid) [Burkholderia sp. KK1]|nr:hypothetical protein A9R05_33850 [Burkholderia sp. KK1]
MENANNENRSKAIKAFEKPTNVEEARAQRLASATGMTFGSAVANVSSASGRVSGMASACSSGKTQERLSDSLQKGGKSEQAAGTDPVKFCDESSDFHHKKGGYGFHAEARLLTELATAAGGNITGGTLTFKTDWRYASARQSDPCISGMPCRGCYQAMCAASNCGLKIYLCNAQNQPVPFENPKGPPCEDADGKNPDNDGLADLDRRMGEDRYTGIANAWTNRAVP